VTYNEIVE
jgi:hypothetical protein